MKSDLREQVLPIGVIVWLAGAMLGEGVALTGAGLSLVGVALRLTAGTFAHRRGLVLLAAFLAWSLASALWAVRPLRSGAPWSVWHWGLFPLAVVALRHVSEPCRRFLCDVFAVLALISAAFCVVQHYVPVFDMPWLGKVVSIGRVVEWAESGGFKAGGLHFHRLRLAHTLLPLGFALVPELWERRRRVLTVAVVAASLIGLAFTYTRASWVALVIGLACALTAVVLPKGRVVATGVVLSLLLVPLAAAFGLHDPEDRSLAWNAALQLCQAHPLHGVGYGGYTSAALALWGGPNPAWPLLHLDAHALLLQVAAEQGAVGLLLWLAMIALYLRWLNDGRVLSPRQLGVVSVLTTLGVVHNWAFHPVVMTAAAFALAFTAAPDRAQGTSLGSQQVR